MEKLEININTAIQFTFAGVNIYIFYLFFWFILHSLFISKT